MSLHAQNFQSNLHQKATGLYFLEAEKISCAITNYGARIVSVQVPDSTGKRIDVALGYPNLEGYLQQPENYMGAIIGRCANRIAGATFELNSRHFQLTPNEGNNLLHSGPEGLHAKVWEVTKQQDHELQLHYLSPDGEGGFPGSLDVKVTYRLEAPATLTIQYQAFADQDTLCNLSNHTYWNLSGEGTDTVLDHKLTIQAAAFTPTNDEQIPKGDIKPVTGTPFDFRVAKTLGQDINAADQQLLYGSGYDQNFVLNGEGFKEAAVLFSPRSQISMRAFTDQPGLQLYTGNHLDGSRKGKSGKVYPRRSAVALETQHFPDALHHPDFPSIILKAGKVFKSQTSYVFA